MPDQDYMDSLQAAQYLAQQQQATGAAGAQEKAAPPKKRGRQAKNAAADNGQGGSNATQLRNRQAQARFRSAIGPEPPRLLLAVADLNRAWAWRLRS